ncbi:unnamed protein product [Owenia fusiformis]|uniref:Uncharacterized protein n=1 Tax=Owenia fusiformis TaxID=6347 RepID=A0A8S4PET9_OWEFU|nr:unnamed protein product [Owenia fusiformis]
MKRKWMKVLNASHHRYQVVCSSHFNKDDFCLSSVLQRTFAQEQGLPLTKLRLNTDAVPTLKVERKPSTWQRKQEVDDIIRTYEKESAEKESQLSAMTVNKFRPIVDTTAWSSPTADALTRPSPASDPIVKISPASDPIAKISPASDPIAWINQEADITAVDTTATTATYSHDADTTATASHEADITRASPSLEVDATAMPSHEADITASLAVDATSMPSHEADIKASLTVDATAMPSHEADITASLAVDTTARTSPVPDATTMPTLTCDQRTITNNERWERIVLCNSFRMMKHVAALRHDTSISDMAFRLEDGTTISTHKFIAVAYSSVIKNTIKVSGKKGYNYFTFALDGSSTIEGVNGFLDFIYGCKLHVTNENYDQILHIAELFDVKDLKETLNSIIRDNVKSQNGGVIPPKYIKQENHDEHGLFGEGTNNQGMGNNDMHQAIDHKDIKQEIDENFISTTEEHPWDEYLNRQHQTNDYHAQEETKYKPHYEYLTSENINNDEAEIHKPSIASNATNLIATVRDHTYMSKPKPKTMISLLKDPLIYKSDSKDKYKTMNSLLKEPPINTSDSKECSVATPHQKSFIPCHLQTWDGDDNVSIDGDKLNPEVGGQVKEEPIEENDCTSLEDTLSEEEDDFDYESPSEESEEDLEKREKEEKEDPDWKFDSDEDKVEDECEDNDDNEFFDEEADDRGNKGALFREKYQYDMVVGDFRCGLCQEVLDTKRDRREHAETEHGKYLCPLCDHYSNTLEECNQHKQSHYVFTKTDGDEGIFFCPVCDLKFTSKHVYLAHVTTTHIVKNKSKLVPHAHCVVCDTWIPTKIFRNHMVDEHEIKKCKICDEELDGISGNAIENHLFEQHDVQGYECEICNFTTHSFQGLKRHLVHKHSIDGKPKYFCEKCNKSVSNIFQHTLVNHSLEVFSCEICNKKFKSQEKLDKHKKACKRGEKSSCEVCGKQFTRSDNLVTHMRIHTGEKPYCCEICSERFAQKHSFDWHMESKHSMMKYNFKEKEAMRNRNKKSKRKSSICLESETGSKRKSKKKNSGH